MSRPDSERALELYKRFSRLTDDVVRFLRVARQFETATRLEIPNLKHASTDLAKLLEDDLNDPDFAERRRGNRASDSSRMRPEDEKPPLPTRPRTSGASPPQPKKPEPLIDLLDSIEPPVTQPSTNPFQQLAQEQSAQETAAAVARAQAQQPQPPMPLQASNTGAGFGGYTAQPQFGTAAQLPSPVGVAPAFGAGMGPGHAFHSNLPAIPQDSMATFQPQAQGFQQQPFPQPQQQQFPFQQMLQMQPTQAPQPATLPQFQPQQTPFSQPSSQTPFQPQPLQPTLTGGRPNNPFRQSMLPQMQMQMQSPMPQMPTVQPDASAAPTLTRQPTNPFTKRRLSSLPAMSTPQPQPLIMQPTGSTTASPTAATLVPQRTSTNPFATRRASQVQATPTGSLTPAPLRPNPTGSTNPFRQSAFVNQGTGLGWQHHVQGTTIGGFRVDGVETMPVFPRPGA